MFRRWVGVLAALLAGCSDSSANIAPEARGGSDVQAFVGDDVALDGSASVDPEGRDLSFEWTLLSKPEASALTEGAVVSESAAHAFAPDAAGAFLFTLVVSDGKNESAPDIVAVTARDALAVRELVPVDGAIGVAGRTPVVAIFAAPVRPWTVAGALIVEDVTSLADPEPFLGTSTLDDGGTAIVFTPVQAWEDGRAYRATIQTGVMGLDGAPLREPVAATFTGAASDGVAPYVISVTPADDAPAQDASTVVTWILSEPIDALSATSAAGLAAAGASGAQDGTVEVGAGGLRVTFVPSITSDPIPLAPDTDYTATLSGVLRDLEGNALENGDYVSSFRTAAGADGVAPRVLAISPFRGASDVLVKLPTVVTFSEPVMPSTVTATSFAVSSNGAAVAGSITMELGNRVAVFKQSANLETAARFDVDIASTITDLAGNALESAISSFFVTGDIAPPSVVDVQPDFAPVASTTTIDVLGEDFLPGATVAIAGGGILVDSVTFVNDGDLLVTLTLSPSAATGLRSIIVTNPDLQQGTGLGVFDVLERPPVVGEVFPTFASQGETTVPLTLTGNYFQENATVEVGGDATGVHVVSVDVVSSSLIDVDITIDPGAPIGVRNVTVENPDGQVFTLDSAFLVRLPIVTGVTPDIRQGETIDVTLTGNYLAPTPAIVTTAGSVNSVTYVSDTQLTVNLTVPLAKALGNYDVRATNPDSTTGQAKGAIHVITALPPTVTSASPPRGAQGQTLDVIVTGADFQVGAVANFAVTTAGVMVNTTTVTSPSTLVANVTILGGAKIALRDVSVTNPVGTVKTGMGSNLFRVTGPVPTVTSVTPGFDQQNASPSGVQVAGTNFRTGAQVSFGDEITVTNVVVANSAGTLITCDLDIDPFALPGFRNVTVTNADTSTGAKADAFEVTPSGAGPNIAQVVRQHAGGKRSDSASSIRQGESAVRFHLMGSGFQSGATVSVSGTGVTVSNVQFKSSARIDVDLSASCADLIPGPRDVRVTNPPPGGGDGLTGTILGGLTLRNGVVINEVATTQQSNHGFGGLLNPSFEVLELYNGSNCTFDITNWRLDFVDTLLTGYEIGTGTEIYGGGTRTSFGPDDFVLIKQPDPGGNTMQDNIFISLFTVTGRYIDDVEIGDNEENDSLTDGGPAAGNNGASTSAAEEMVGRCPNGSDTDGDIFDFFQNELASPFTQMAATDASANDGATGQCPPCADGLDNDGDGWRDMLDPGCSDPHTDGAETGDPTPAPLCNDNQHNDADGLMDEADPDCFSGADNNEAS